jgi:hypothetical protein
VISIDSIGVLPPSIDFHALKSSSTLNPGFAEALFTEYLLAAWTQAA